MGPDPGGPWGGCPVAGERPGEPARGIGTCVGFGLHVILRMDTRKQNMGGGLDGES